MNAASISKIINKTGLPKASSGTTRIRGYHHFSEGYKATTGYESKCIVITYESGSSMRFDADEFTANKRYAFAKIAELMTSKGYQVEGDQDSYRLIIRDAAKVEA